MSLSPLRSRATWLRQAFCELSSLGRPRLPANFGQKPLLTAFVLGAFGFAACDEGGGGISEEEAPLTDLDILLEGAPDPDKLPDEPKSDAAYPKQFDLVELQSPVRNQASRGVCSIFSTVALMEHLYIKDGSLKNPDFSEQFLQWSVKFEVGAFKNTEGSNADRNLEAIYRYGIVDEATSPYQTSPWNSSHDARCTGDDRPTLCFTNGEPTADVKAAKRWKLPKSRWVSGKRQSIKAFMFQNKQAVTAGMTFFYQSWNHRGGPLPVSSDYARKGYILYPNARDKEIAKEKPAGHSILIVGWDDDLEVPTVDENGAIVKDADGNVVTEKGFFLIKNSWGTGNFGTTNPFGAGYGWLSMRYVEEYATINGADMPRVDLGPEQCDDGKDNNYNGLVDCEDADACRTNPACNGAQRIFEGKPNKTIPDNIPAGLVSELGVDLAGTATEVWVEVDISHTFIRDLTLKLSLPSGKEVTLYDRADKAGRDMRRRFLLPNLIGEATAGTWKLTVIDAQKGDTGKLNRWAIGLSAEGATLVEICDDGRDNDNNALVDCLDPACENDPICVSSGPPKLDGINVDTVAIPDQNAQGASSTITISGNGTITDVAVDVEITHTYRGDLTVTLIHPDGTKAKLLDQQGGSAQNVDARFTTSAFNGKKAVGNWTLNVVDGFAGDTGTLEGWILEVDVK